MNGILRATLFFLPAAALLAGIPKSLFGQEGLAGVPYPVSDPTYCQPVTKSAVILQDGPAAHGRGDSAARHGWNYKLDPGTPIAAARSGVVISVQNHSNIGGADPEKYLREANTVVIDHLDGTGAEYSHLQKSRDPVQRGDYVLQGEVIGYSGDTGFTLQPHLFFTVLESASRESIPALFADFKKNGGSPGAGDTVPAAPPPAVPQEAIAEYKTLWRASLRAEQLGRHDLAWMIAGALPRKRYPDYFYDKVLSAREKALRERLTEQLTRLARVASPDSGEIMEALLHQEALSRTKDPEMRALLHDLKAGMQGWTGGVVEEWKKEKKGIACWCEGMRRECFLEIEKAVKSYADALRSCRRGPFEKEAESALMRIIRKANSDTRHAFSRLAHEAEIALGKHRVRIEEEAERVWKAYKPLHQAWEKNFSGEKEKAREVYAELESQYERLVRE